MKNMRQVKEKYLIVFQASIYMHMGPNPHSAGIDYTRQNLTSIDVRSRRLKSIPVE